LRLSVQFYQASEWLRSNAAEELNHGEARMDRLLGPDNFQ
jgi:hypothetical protein